MFLTLSTAPYLPSTPSVIIRLSRLLALSVVIGLVNISLRGMFIVGLYMIPSYILMAAQGCVSWEARTGMFPAVDLNRIVDVDVMVKANLGAKNHAIIMPDGNFFCFLFCLIAH